MSVYGVLYASPKNILTIFNPSEFSTTPISISDVGITTTYLANNYLQYPIAQGNETLQNTTVNGTLGVSSNATVTGTLGVTGNTTLSTVGVSSNATVGGTLNVTGVSTLVTLNAQTTQLTQLGISGTTTCSGTVTITADQGISYTPQINSLGAGGTTQVSQATFSPSLADMYDGQVFFLTSTITTFNLPTAVRNFRFSVYNNSGNTVSFVATNGRFFIAIKADGSYYPGVTSFSFGTQRWINVQVCNIFISGYGYSYIFKEN